MIRDAIFVNLCHSYRCWINATILLHQSVLTSCTHKFCYSSTYLNFKKVHVNLFWTITLCVVKGYDVAARRVNKGSSRSKMFGLYSAQNISCGYYGFKLRADIMQSHEIWGTRTLTKTSPKIHSNPIFFWSYGFAMCGGIRPLYIFT